MLKKMSFAFLATTSILSASDQKLEEDTANSHHVLIPMESVPLLEEESNALRSQKIETTEDFDIYIKTQQQPLPVHFDIECHTQKYNQVNGLTIAKFVKFLEVHPDIQTLIWKEYHYVSGYSSDIEAQKALTSLQSTCPQLNKLRSLTLGYEQSHRSC